MLTNEQASAVANGGPGRYRLSIICGAAFGKLVAESVKRAAAGTYSETIALLATAGASSLTENAFTLEEVWHPAFRVRCPDCKLKHALVRTRTVLDALQQGLYFRTRDFAILLSIVGWEDDQFRAFLRERDVSRPPKWRDALAAEQPRETP